MTSLIRCSTLTYIHVVCMCSVCTLAQSTMADHHSTTLDDRMRCEVCEQISPKYKCPRCGVKTCSLHCVKRHKSTQDCSGVRDKAAFVTIKNFTDRHLLNDYRFLEDVDRKAYSAVTDEASKQHQYTNKYQQLSRNCKSRKVWLSLLPPVFSRHKENTSYFQRKEKTIYWRVHWKFPQSDAEFVNKSVSEKLPLIDILALYLDPVKGDPVRRQRLKRYCQEGLDNLRLFMKDEGRPANSVRYHELDVKDTLCGNLTCKSVIEFPTIHVVLREFADGYTIKSKDHEIISQPNQEAPISPTGQVTPQPYPEATTNPTDQVTPQPNPEASINPTGEVTPQPNPEATINPTDQVTPQPNPEATINPTGQVTPKLNPEATINPTGQVTQPNPDATINPTDHVTPQPNPEATINPTGQVTPKLNPEATINPTGQVTQPNPDATINPTNHVTPQPNPEATINPTGQVTPKLNPEATINPTGQVTQPNPDATINPTDHVTPQPNPEATINPTGQVTPQPNPEATINPTGEVTSQPNPEATINLTSQVTPQPNSKGAEAPTSNTTDDGPDEVAMSIGGETQPLDATETKPNSGIGNSEMPSEATPGSDPGKRVYSEVEEMDTTF
ncbi:mucin-2-like [Asterias rubens]|uniref:mucin-2-like n=1 Tax=Asterias rubens TaxID=7604 RepID=UPI001455357F|nr:mucin-2-like [Asterias rubens]